MNYTNYRVFLLSLLIFPLSIFGNNDLQDNFKSRLNSFKQLEIKAFYDSTLVLIVELNEKDNFDLSQSQLLFEAIKSKESIFGHRLHWIHSSGFTELQKMIYLDYAENLALKHKDKSNEAWVYLSKGRLFQLNKHHESSINNILNARKIYRTIGDSLNLSSSNHLIGNLFFEAELFSIALEYFQIADRQLKGGSEYINEKKFINNNTISSAYIKLNNFDSAIKILDQNLEKYYPNLPAYTKRNALSYVYGLYAEAFLGANDLERAEENILKAIATVKRDEFFLNGRYFYIKGKIEFENRDYTKSLESVLKALRIFQENWIPFEREPELLRLLSKNYDQQKDYKKALLYLNQYNDLNRAEELKADKAKSILLISEQSYNQLNTKYDDNRKMLRNLIIGLLFALGLISIVFVQYLKIRNANLKLVKKGLELEEKSVFHSPKYNTKNKENLELLVEEFAQLMFEYKPFLDRGFNLSKAATLLETNTSYLSEAINSILNKNFNTYVNILRIEYAIELIKEGEANKITIEALAERSGFKNRSVFNSSFKTYAGVTPSFFIKNYKDQL